MKKSKTQKGITLIALIITIVVLLILAVVAISSIQNDNILSYANNAAIAYNQAQVNEQEILDGYLNYMPGNSGESIKKAEVGTIVSSNSTIDGETYSSTNPVIPVGFKAIDTETAKWGETDGYKKGLVISDGTSEFVWIPVSEINTFARLQDGSTTNYRGVVYNWETDSTGKTEYTWSSNSTNNIEPSNASAEANETNLLYQESFNKMVESVKKYKGFYVGRYETSLNGSVSQSISGVTPMCDVNWFDMYENSKTYSISNKNLGVVSEMIWGCQWDAMLKFILTGAEASHVGSTSNVSHDLSEVYQTGGTNYTGSVTYNDMASNIYDLEGNVREWTQESDSMIGRYNRGGFVNYGFSPSNRYNDAQDYVPTAVGSRLSLYVEV